jgi:hypothetical protein
MITAILRLIVGILSRQENRSSSPPANFPNCLAITERFENPEDASTLNLHIEQVNQDYPIAESCAHSFYISEEYNEYSDATIVMLDLEVVRHTSGGKLELTVQQLFKGQGRLEPDGQPLFEFIQEGDFRYREDHSISLFADGERMEFDPFYYDDLLSEFGPGLEYMWIYPSEGQLLKMVHAKTIKITVGLDGFQLDQARLYGLVAFVSLIAEPSRCLPPGGHKNPRRSACFQYRDIEARQKEEAESESRDREQSLRNQIQLNIRLGRDLEDINVKKALLYYREIVKLSNGLTPEPPELEEAMVRIKALESAE